MVIAAGEITVAGKFHRETVVRGVVPNIGIDYFIDDLSSVDRKGLMHQHCEKKEGDKDIKNDVMGWTVLRRSKKQRKKAVPIFVKLDGMKTVLREVSPEDEVQEILNTVGGTDQDGRMLRKEDQLKSCGVRDGGGRFRARTG